MDLKGKKVLVFGAGKSGIGAADLLGSAGAQPVIYDGNADLDKEAVLHKTNGKYTPEIWAGDFPERALDSLDLVVLSPGVPTDLPLVKSFYEKGLPVWSEVELAYRTGKGEVLAITGTNGKTTTTASMGSILAAKGYKVLLIDLDAQANLTSSLLKANVENTIYDGLKEQSSKSLIIYKVREDVKLDIIPADLNLAQADLELAGKMARERILSDLLEDYKEQYDYIFIDCPPSLGLLTLNALTASDYAIIPLVAEVLPFNGLKMIFDFINKIKKVLNPKINIFGIVITRWEQTKLSKNIEKGLRTQLHEMVFSTKIRKNVTIAQAPLETVNIVDYDKKSNGAIDYMSLVDEFLERMK